MDIILVEIHQEFLVLLLPKNMADNCGHNTKGIFQYRCKKKLKMSHFYFRKMTNLGKAISE
jgi:hypothetical protein